MSMEGVRNGYQMLPVHELSIGMYVAELEGQNLSSAAAGFHIRSRTTIERLSRECSYVLVDPNRYDRSVLNNGLGGRTTGTRQHGNRLGPQPVQESRELLRVHTRLHPEQSAQHRTTVDFGEGLADAMPKVRRAAAVFITVADALRATGNLHVKELQEAIAPLLDNLLANPDPLCLLARTQIASDYAAAHPMASAIWAGTLARHLGFKRSDIETLALSCAIAGMGNAQIPCEIVHCDVPLSESQWRMVHEHVGETLDLLDRAGVADSTLVNAVATHHERFNGSGYPNGLTDDAIPVFGRIAGLVDSYDAMITPRPHADARSSYDAIKELQKHADILFQRELVDEFVACIGMFPLGAIVELSNGSVAVVTRANPARRLRPVVCLALSSERERVEPDSLDLAECEGLWIARELARGAHGINPLNYFSG